MKSFLFLIGSAVLLTTVQSYLINPTLELSRNCYNDYQCGLASNNSYCNPLRARCQCNLGYRPRRPAVTECELEMCSSDMQCSSTFGMNTICNQTSRTCICNPNGWALNNETQVCYSKPPTPSWHPIQPVPIIPIVPVEPVIPPQAKAAELGTTCGWNGHSCGGNASCWYSTCICPTGYYPTSTTNCSKIECNTTTDCLVFEKHSYCNKNIFNPALNRCSCLYGVDFSTQRCQKEVFYPTYNYDSGYYSFVTSYISILVFVFIITLIATVIRSCRNKNNKRVTTARLQSPKNAPPPPPYTTKA